MLNDILKYAPKNEHFLVRNTIYSYDKTDWVIIGWRWIEAWFNPSKQKFEQWIGGENRMTTEPFEPIDWIKMPDNIQEN